MPLETHNASTPSVRWALGRSDASVVRLSLGSTLSPSDLDVTYVPHNIVYQQVPLLEIGRYPRDLVFVGFSELGLRSLGRFLHTTPAGGGRWSSLLVSAMAPILDSFEAKVDPV